MSSQPTTFDCPGNYIASAPTTLRCSKCNRPLMTKDAKHTPTGYVCPFYLTSRKTMMYNATPIQYLIVGALSLIAGVVAGFALNLAGSIPFVSIIVTFFLAPAAGAAISEILRNTLKKTRGQYFAHVASVAVVVGAAFFTIVPAVLSLARGNLAGIWSWIPVVGLGILVSALVARIKVWS
jgi:hypothetical protein